MTGVRVTAALANKTMIGQRLSAGLLGRTLDSIPPAAGAEVMGTGIVRGIDDGEA